MNREITIAPPPEVILIEPADSQPFQALRTEAAEKVAIYERLRRDERELNSKHAEQVREGSAWLDVRAQQVLDALAAGTDLPSIPVNPYSGQIDAGLRAIVLLTENRIPKSRREAVRAQFDALDAFLDLVILFCEKHELKTAELSIPAYRFAGITPRLEDSPTIGLRKWVSQTRFNWNDARKELELAEYATANTGREHAPKQFWPTLVEDILAEFRRRFANATPKES